MDEPRRQILGDEEKKRKEKKERKKISLYFRAIAQLEVKLSILCIVHKYIQ